MTLIDSIIIGVITGAFSAGTTYGILRMELKFLRRDINEVRNYLWPDRRMIDKHNN